MNQITQTLKTAAKIVPLILLAALPFGCATTGPEDERDYWTKSVQQVVGVPASSIHAIFSKTVFHSVVLSDDYIHICGRLFPGDRREPFADFPLNNITAVDVVNDAKGADGNVYAGVRLTFDQPVQTCYKKMVGFYSDRDNVISFDVGTVYLVQNGVVVDSVSAGSDWKKNTIAAKAFQKALLTQLSSVKSGGASSTTESVEVRLKRLKQLLDNGTIDQKVYEQRAAELLKSI
jgi:hypothetical protein